MAGMEVAASSVIAEVVVRFDDEEELLQDVLFLLFVWLGAHQETGEHSVALGDDLRCVAAEGAGFDPRGEGYGILIFQFRELETKCRVLGGGPWNRTGGIGVGGVIRDHTGVWIGGFMVNIGAGEVLQDEA
ncbi:hypothetical protein ACLB2K_025863 [Fragaria x ananassa]